MEAFCTSQFEYHILQNKINPDKITSIEFNKMMNDLAEKFNSDKKAEISLLLTIDHTETLLEEAMKYFDLKNYHLAIVLYSTWIEHCINDIIIYGAKEKKLKDKEINYLIKSTNNLSKFSWLLPLLDLPRISEPYQKKINTIIELRNAFVHYKWTPKTEELDEKEAIKYKKNCSYMPQLIKYLKTYKSKNICNTKRLKKIVKREFANRYDNNLIEKHKKIC